MQMTSTGALEAKNVQAVYDLELKILRVSYRGILNSEVTNQFYSWLIPIIQAQPHVVAEARGSIYDFRQVTEFENQNVSVARKQSQSVTQKSLDLKRHPTALVVANEKQRRMVAVMMVLTHQTDRKRLVYSVEEAENFISEWHESHPETE